EEFTQAYKGERTFRRLQEAQIDISSYGFSTIFVDPPRAGIDDETLKLLQHFERIIYISCNPDTLHDNLKQLTQTHKISKFALFDQFPYTHHIESGVLLEKRYYFVSIYFLVTQMEPKEAPFFILKIRYLHELNEISIKKYR